MRYLMVLALLLVNLSIAAAEPDRLSPRLVSESAPEVDACFSSSSCSDQEFDRCTRACIQVGPPYTGGNWFLSVQCAAQGGCGTHLTVCGCGWFDGGGDYARCLDPQPEWYALLLQPTPPSAL